MMITQKASSSFYHGLEVPLFNDALVPLTKAIFSWLPATKAPGWLRGLFFRMALKRAYTSFAGYYPQWAASLFDEHFLRHGAALLLASYKQNGTLPQASELALVWDDQLGPTTAAIRERRMAELIPVAADFLDWLAVELAISSFS
jgi:hypothetical protein